MKHLLFYSGVTDGAGDSLKRILEKSAPGEQIEICRTVHSLAYKLLPLRTIADSQQMVHVLVATSTQELMDIHSIRDLLSDLRIILIVPTRDEETIAKAHELYPRYLSYLDENFTEVGSVFGKMANNKKELCEAACA